MATPFQLTTAEAIVAVTEAAVLGYGAADLATVVAFTGFSETKTKGALAVAIDIGLVADDQAAQTYSAVGPLARFLCVASDAQRVAVLRIALEDYAPFKVFRERLSNAPDPLTAARHVRVMCGLAGGDDELEETLLDLGTYTRAITSMGGGRFEAADPPAGNDLERVAELASGIAQAEAQVALALGDEVAQWVSRSEVLEPLTDALVKSQAAADAAVHAAGNAVENYLNQLGAAAGCPVDAVTGVNGKAQDLLNGKVIPKKLFNVSKYLGHVRNGADHGADPETGKSWDIDSSTGINYIFVACSFIKSCYAYHARRECSL